MELVGDAAAVSSSHSLSSRNRTSGSIAWNPEACVAPSCVEGRPLHTPDLSTLVTEVMAQTSWTPGSAVLFIFT